MNDSNYEAGLFVFLCGLAIGESRNNDFVAEKELNDLHHFLALHYVFFPLKSKKFR